MMFTSGKNGMLFCSILVCVIIMYRTFQCVFIYTTIPTYLEKSCILWGYRLLIRIGVRCPYYMFTKKEEPIYAKVEQNENEVKKGEYSYSL